jgi:hypothetical protein
MNGSDVFRALDGGYLRMLANLDCGFATTRSQRYEDMLLRRSPPRTTSCGTRPSGALVCSASQERRFRECIEKTSPLSLKSLGFLTGRPERADGRA